MSVGRALSLHRSVWYYQTHKDDSDVTQKLQQYAEQYPKEALMITMVKYAMKVLIGTEKEFFVFIGR